MVPDALDPRAWNRLGYVYGNPVNYTDPSGHFACAGLCIAAIGIGIGLGAFGGHLAATSAGYDVGSPQWYGTVATGGVFGGISGGFGYAGYGLLAFGFSVTGDTIIDAAILGNDLGPSLVRNAALNLAFDGVGYAIGLGFKGFKTYGGNFGHYAWIRANVAVRSTRTPRNGAVFWSGYVEGNKAAAQAYAKSIGGRTVEMTNAGLWLDSAYPWDTHLAKMFGLDTAGAIWDNVAARFARGASGEVNTFLIGMRGVPGLSSKTYFRIEKPILEQGIATGRVTRVNEYWDPH